MPRTPSSLPSHCHRAGPPGSHLALALVLGSLLLPAQLTAQLTAQPSAAVDTSGRRWTAERQLGAGFGTLLGFEANPRGANLHLALSAGRRAGALRFRPEARYFLLPEVGLPACILDDAEGCFQTARRDVSSIAAAVEARLPFLRTGENGPYVVLGAGAFHSRTRMQRYQSCTRLQCTDGGSSLTYSETSPGVLLALGATMELGSIPAFWEAGWQRTRRRPDAAEPAYQRLAGYTLLPFSLGVRW